MFGLFRKTNIRKATDEEKIKGGIKDEENCGYCCGPEPAVKEKQEEKKKVTAASC